MIFGSYPQGGTTKQLIVSNKDYSLRRVSVNDVDGKKQGLMVEAEAEMGPGKKVEEKRTHAPLNLRLGIDHGGSHMVAFSIASMCSRISSRYSCSTVADSNASHLALI